MRARVKVDKDLRAPGYSDVFIIGDCALMINEELIVHIHQQHKLLCNKVICVRTTSLHS